MLLASYFIRFGGYLNLPLPMAYGIMRPKRDPIFVIPLINLED